MVAIAAGAFHNMALSREGEVRARSVVPSFVIVTTDVPTGDAAACNQSVCCVLPLRGSFPSHPLRLLRAALLARTTP
jgi:hypothetical protein